MRLIAADQGWRDVAHDKVLARIVDERPDGSEFVVQCACAPHAATLLNMVRRRREEGACV